MAPLHLKNASRIAAACRETLRARDHHTQPTLYNTDFQHTETNPLDLQGNTDKKAVARPRRSILELLFVPSTVPSSSKGFP
jgi:hypothetical protein